MLYSSGVFDLTSPVTITMPDAGARFQSLRAINQNHYIVQNTYDAASYTFTQGSVGTRYLHMAKRTLSDPENPEDMARALQDQVAWTMDDPDVLEFPDRNAEQRDGLFRAILQMAPYVPDSSKMFGPREEVDPVRHLIGTAGGSAGLGLLLHHRHAGQSGR